MRIILLNNHEAIALDDNSNDISMEPAVSGELVVRGKSYIVQHGGIAPVLEDNQNVTAAFVTDGGTVYKILSPIVYRGVLTTRLDPYEYSIESRLHIDRLEKDLEQLRAEFAAYRGRQEYNALSELLG